MLLPALLKNMNVKFSGADFTGKVEEVTPPKISYKTEEVRLSGMLAPLEVDVGLEKLEASFKMLEQTYEAYLAAGLNPTGFVTAIVLGNLERQGGPRESVECVIRGWIKKIEPGTWKAGDVKSATQTVEMAVYGFTLARNKIPMATVDVEANIFQLGVTDQYDAVRRNLLLN